MMTIFFSVGEPSGDLHGANLIRELRSRRSDLRCVGYGGPRMADAGCELHSDLTQHAVMWFVSVLLNVHKFLALLIRADRYFRDERPDAVVLIDYPGFNWWIARRAKARGIPVFYYGTPQLWAWAGWRIKKMRRYVDHALCKLPFEEKWYRDRGCQAIYVGHPYFDELIAQKLDAEFIAAQQLDPTPLVTILPGSRTQEVRANLPWLIRAAERVRQRVPNVRFAIAAFNPSQAEYARQLADELQCSVEVHVSHTPELIHSATCCMAVSGSVSLELLYHTKPSVILYHVTRLGFWGQPLVRKVRYITLVNLITTPDLQPKTVGVYDRRDPVDAHVLMPEYMTCGDRSAEVAGHLIEWLTDPAAREHRIAELAALKQRIAHGGASRRAAEYILASLDGQLTAPAERSAA
ncbi:MAG: lipid-A-disaccharide synthase [Pirellulales bacterium]